MGALVILINVFLPVWIACGLVSRVGLFLWREPKSPPFGEPQPPDRMRYALVNLLAALICAPISAVVLQFPHWEWAALAVATLCGLSWMLIDLFRRRRSRASPSSG